MFPKWEFSQNDIGGKYFYCENIKKGNELKFLPKIMGLRLGREKEISFFCKNKIIDFLFVKYQRAGWKPNFDLKLVKTLFQTKKMVFKKSRVKIVRLDFVFDNSTRKVDGKMINFFSRKGTESSIKKFLH